MKIIGMIPARWASTRLAGKVLADIKGKPMIQHVWERAKRCVRLDEVYVVCDHERVQKTAEAFGARTVMTSPEHASGTERIAEAARGIASDIVVNIQGDEPLVDPETIDAVAGALAAGGDCPVATPVVRITDEADIANPNTVKVVIDRDRRALYFSRSAIPYNRDRRPFSECVFYKHLGIYAYRRDFLLAFHDLPPSSLERTERLEQLRVLEAGARILTVETRHDTIGVDTAEDLKRVAGRLNGANLS